MLIIKINLERIDKYKERTYKYFIILDNKTVKEFLIKWTRYNFYTQNT